MKQRPLALGLPPSGTQGGRCAVPQVIPANVLRFVLRPRKDDTAAMRAIRQACAARLRG